MNQPRTIAVTGTGKASTPPDTVWLSMTLEAQNLVYAGAVQTAETQLSALTSALAAAGFDPADLKTTNFHVRTDYRSEQDEKGNYRNVFNGFVCSHALKLSFDFDTARLATALGTITACLAEPRLEVAFTIKNADAFAEELLRLAAQNARQQAEILCEAAGERLGQLLNVDYTSKKAQFASSTRYAMEDSCLRGAAPMMAKAININPDDIEAADSATFIWALA